MLTDLERMAEGNIHKAKSGRVTSRTPAYGYKFVNSRGGVEDVNKDTYYAFAEPEATVMRKVYCWLVEERATLGVVSRRLTDMGAQPPKTSRTWELALLRKLVTNTVYKGEFYAHRYTYVTRLSERTGKEVVHKIERPRNEWILVPVPALVTPEVWAEAQKVMSENRTLSMRNAKANYLLVGLTCCADCKITKMTIGTHATYHDTAYGRRRYESTHYRCTNRVRPKHILQAMGYSCTMPQISSQRLDDLVWNAITQVLLDQHRLEEGLDRYFSEQRTDTTREEIVFIQSQFTELEFEDELLYQAYKARAFDADEYAQKRHALKEQQQRLQETKEQLQKRLSHQVSKQEWKQQILASAQVLRHQAANAVPFELKRRVVLQVVDKVKVHSREEWFELEGAISGKFDFIPGDTGFAPQAA
jgi:site-specific DNA recombinase